MGMHVALLRGINVGGKKVIRMTDLAAAFTGAGYEHVHTYIQSGNVLFDGGGQDGRELEDHIEQILEHRFGVPFVVVVRSRDELAATVALAPASHGSPELRSDVIFLKHPLTADEALEQMPEPREGVDKLATGPGAIYWSRLDARASSSRMSRVMGRPVYRQMTVRNWRTTTKLMDMIDAG